MDLFTELGKATKPKKPSQCKQILVWLRAGNGITFLEALRMFGCGNLKGRIYDLRKKGYDIPNPAEKIRTASGKWIAKYTLIQK
jgi:hypothetical protein